MIILNIVAVAVIVAIVFFALLGPLANQQNQSYKSSNTYVPEDSYSSSSNNRPKISAEVSDSLYDDVRSSVTFLRSFLCQKLLNGHSQVICDFFI